MNNTAAEVVANTFCQAEHRRPWVVLVDGAHHQIDLIEAEAGQRGADIHIIVDLIHVLEHLWRGLVPARHRRALRRDLGRPPRPPLLAGDVQKDHRRARGPARTARLCCAERRGIHEAVSHLANKAQYPRHDTAEKAVADRHRHHRRSAATRSKIGWTSPGAPGSWSVLLKLRAVRANSDFEAYCAWYEQPECTRIHHACAMTGSYSPPDRRHAPSLDLHPSPIAAPVSKSMPGTHGQVTTGISPPAAQSLASMA